MTYAFTFDARFCSGCKACQAACKDKNNLPVGVLWRRVYEVSGGDWRNVGGGSPNPVWENTVFAYNVSMSCNHCEHPKCAGVCPVDAYHVREDGIVILDSTKCVGCGYCAWACPYGAPQYNPQAGYMTKCDFCFEYLDQGLFPACVAACPMRVLDYGNLENKDGLALWEVPPETHPFPMPVYSHTQPRLAIQPHAGMNRTDEKSVSNLEEVQPRKTSGWEEAPLIVFTLLGQLAVGGFWAWWILIDRLMTTLSLIPHLMIGTSLGVSLLASFAHLGTKRKAWRVLGHLSHSWLSREILFAGLFGLGWLTTSLLSATGQQVLFEAGALTSVFGIGLVYSMGQVYRIPAAPGWNSWRTNAGFMVSALVLGISSMAPTLLYVAGSVNMQVSKTAWSLMDGCILILLLVQAALIQKRSTDRRYHTMRFGLIFSGIALTLLHSLMDANVIWVSALIFLLVQFEEGVGRWLFYRSRL